MLDGVFEMRLPAAFRFEFELWREGLNHHGRKQKLSVQHHLLSTSYLGTGGCCWSSSPRRSMKGGRSFFFYGAVSTTIGTTFIINRWESQYFQRHLRSLHLTQKIKTATYPTVGAPPLKVRVRSAPSPSISPSPRVVCLDSSDKDCRTHHADALYEKMDMIPSWDATAMIDDENTRQKSLRSSSDASKNKCQLSDPSYQDKRSAPSTCNNVHELGFSLSTFNFLGNGASKAAWSNNVLTNDYDGKEHYVMKTAVYGTLQSQVGFETEWRRNQRDAIIMERAGRGPNSYESNVLPLYQFCAVTNVVPRATNELGRYVRDMGMYMNAKEVYHLAIQAARALYQVHAYKDGKATFVHADVKPSQFLLFEPPTKRSRFGGSNSDEKDDLDQHRHRLLPLLQINDFNRGEYVKVKQLMNKNNSTVSCPLQDGCNKPDMKATFYRSPEEYKECTDRSAASDVHSLGNILYYILSNGLRPFYQFNRETNSIAINDYILKGKLPKLPTPLDYKQYKNFTDEQIDFVMKRQEHPLLVVVRDVMKGCWSFDAKDRPTSLDVLQMLERGGQTF